MARRDGAIHALAVPTPFAVGDVNAYLIEDDPLTLIDGGPNSATGMGALEALLGEHGHRVEDLELLIITHQHMDHLGLTGELARRSGAEVACLDLLAPYVEDWEPAGAADDDFALQIMLGHGVEARVGTALRAVARIARGWGASTAVHRRLADGDVVELARRRLRVLYRPGHSPSDTVFHDEEHGILVGGDHLLSRVSSNALIARSLEPGGDQGGRRPRPLLTYRASLRATRDLELEVVLGGHGEPVRDHRALIDERLQAQERRAERFLDVLEAGPLSAHDLAYAIWGDVAITQVYLTLSEVLGHLDLLIDRELVAELEDDDGVTRFTPTP